MKHQKPKQFTEWSVEKTQSQIDLVTSQRNDLDRQLNDLNSQINVLLDKKKSIQMRIGNKHKYLNQLQKQLEEICVKK